MKQLNNNTFRKNSWNRYWKKLCFIKEHPGKTFWSRHWRYLFLSCQEQTPIGEGREASLNKVLGGLQ